jgi:hypothetical protein
MRFDPAHPEQPSSLRVPYACYTLEALSIDPQGQALMSGVGCESVFAYDSTRAVWRELMVPGLLSPRGIAALPGETWIAYDSGSVARIPGDVWSVETAVSLATDAHAPYETVALSVDADGQLWAISTQGGPDGVGLATRFDPVAGEVTAQVPLDRGPRGSGDMSGYASGGEYAREGSATHVFLGCGHEDHEQMSATLSVTHWRRLHVASRYGEAASVVVAIRHAASDDALADVPFTMLGEVPRDGDAFDLDLPDGGALEVQLTLLSPAALGAPRVQRVGIEWDCPGPD